MSQNVSLASYRVPEIPNGIEVLGVRFQAFIDPQISEAVFSQRGVARALKIPRSSLANILTSEAFKTLLGKGYSWPSRRLNTTVSTRPIAIVTQLDLVFLVQIAAEKGYPVAKSMQEASFAVLLQQSVDEALNISRTRSEYLEAGANLRQQLEYRHSYHSMKESTFKHGHGVLGLCRVNKQVSALAVPDADVRRSVSKKWRQKCSAIETVKITIGNTVHQKAVEASDSLSLSVNLHKAAERTTDIYRILEAPF